MTPESTTIHTAWPPRHPCKTRANRYAAIMQQLQPRPTTVTLPEVRLAETEMCGNCKDWKPTPRNNFLQGRRCHRCHGTGIAGHPDPDDSLAGMSDSVADWAVQQACCIVSPYWMEKPSEARMVMGEEWQSAVAAWYAARFSGDKARNWLKLAMTMAQYDGAGLSLTRWWRHITARLAFADALSVELEAE